MRIAQKYEIMLNNIIESKPIPKRKIILLSVGNVSRTLVASRRIQVH